MCQAFGLDPPLQVKTSKESVHAENTTQPPVPTMSSATVSSSDPPPVLGDEPTTPVAQPAMQTTMSSATVSSPVAPPVLGDEPTAQVENSQSINDSGIGLEGIE